MVARWIGPVIVLPGTVLVFIPLTILWISRGAEIFFPLASPVSIAFWIALFLAILGLSLAISSGSLFYRFGGGTAAPWDPPQRLVVRGPYRHVRNPMLSGAILLLLAEALFFQSWLLGIWAGVFILANALYFPFVEEPGLRKRFGNDYDLYCKHVGRWIPRLRPWKQP